MKKNKGFTLIELLVVIAIIGILASVVLASLSSARTKAKVAAVQSTLSSTRAQAEIGVDATGKYIADLCNQPATAGGFQQLIESLNKSASKVTSVGCGQDAASGAKPMRWAVEALINGKYFCADSTGYSGLSGGNSATAGTAAATGATQRTVPATPFTPAYGVADLVCAS